MKKLVRLTESDLHRIVKESVNRVLNEDEEHGGTDIQDVLNAIEDAIYSTVDEKIARMSADDRTNTIQTLVRFVIRTFSRACETAIKSSINHQFFNAKDY